MCRSRHAGSTLKDPGQAGSRTWRRRVMALPSVVGHLPGFDPGRSRRQAEAAEPSTDGSPRGHHLRGSPALLRRQASLLGEKPPDGVDALLDLGIGKVRQREGLPVEYAGWVRIVGT